MADAYIARRLKPSTSDPSAKAADRWEPSILNFAVLELMREFPRVKAEVVVGAVNIAAQLLKPTEGRVALLQRARAALR